MKFNKYDKIFFVTAILGIVVAIYGFVTKWDASPLVPAIIYFVVVVTFTLSICHIDRGVK
jgi:FtsH-binding integral membrane protein